MFYMNLLLYFLLGCCLASFVPCFAERRQKHLSQRGRSRCLICGAEIAWHDLIPIAGYLVTQGRCRHCGTPISKRYPIFEATGGLLALMLGAAAMPTLHTLLLLASLSVLFLLSLDDAFTQQISDSDLLIYAILLLCDSLLYGSHEWLLQGLGAILIALPLWIITRLRPDALGEGDVIFMAISGFYLGANGIAYAFLIGILAALLYAISLLLWRNANIKTAIPLIPFLSFGIAALMMFNAFIST